MDQGHEEGRHSLGRIVTVNEGIGSDMKRMAHTLNEDGFKEKNE